MCSREPGAAAESSGSRTERIAGAGRAELARTRRSRSGARRVLATRPNMLMSLGALVWSEQSKKLFLHSAACFHAGNAPWLRLLFLAAVGVQVADAHIKADG